MLIACALLAFLPVHAQDVTLDQELSILSDRFYLSFPKEAKNEARAVDIMSAPPGEEKETRITMDTGDERLVFFAQELGLLGTYHLATDWKKVIDKDGSDAFDVQTMRDNKQVEVVSYVPRTLDTTNDAILVHGILVRCADGMLMRGQAYINHAAVARLPFYQDLVEEVFASLHPGKRVMNLSARTARYSFAGSQDREIVIDLPKDHVVTTEGAYDFFVYHISRAMPLGEEKNASITLYFGSHPSLFMKELGVSEENVERTPGMLFGKRMEWMTTHDESRGIEISEQIVPRDKDGRSVVHVAITGNDSAEIASLIDLVQKIRIEP